VRREPDIGQQFTELIGGMGRQATEDVLEVREGIDFVVIAGAGQRVEDRRRPADLKPYGWVLEPFRYQDLKHAILSLPNKVLGPVEKRLKKLRG
jgi:hypothetical protein